MKNLQGNGCLYADLVSLGKERLAAFVDAHYGQKLGITPVDVLKGSGK